MGALTGHGGNHRGSGMDSVTGINALLSEGGCYPVLLAARHVATAGTLRGGARVSPFREEGGEI